MTATTTAPEPTKEQRMAARGFFPAAGPGRCCLCRRQIHGGQFIGRMPGSWKPESKRRHAHYKCVDELVARIRAKAEAAR